MFKMKGAALILGVLSYHEVYKKRHRAPREVVSSLPLTALDQEGPR